MNGFESYYDRVVRQVPGWLAGLIDSARPSSRHSLGGPFDGWRVCTVLPNLAWIHPFDAVIGTGTYRGRDRRWT
jgi:hypothetical protein